MTWMNGFFWIVAAAALLAAGGCLMLHRSWQRRFLALRKEVTQFSEDMLQMIELQSDIYHRVSRSLNDIEEKVLDLSVPSSETQLPLERRHQVLTLARKGVALDEISRRLNMPKGEAELILGLRKYADGNYSPERVDGVIKKYAQAAP
jgi:hypothetical protein